MQWVFLVLGLWAALVELHTGTFYLAAVAAVALATVVLGFWIPPEWLVVVFLLGCAGAMLLVWTARRHLPRGRGLTDLDVGQDVTVTGVASGGKRLVVTYRGSRWDAVMASGSPPAIGDQARIARRDGSLLYLVVPPGAAQPHPVEETS